MNFVLRKIKPFYGPCPTLKPIGQRFENAWFCQNDWMTEAPIWELWYMKWLKFPTSLKRQVTRDKERFEKI